MDIERLKTIIEEVCGVSLGSISEDSNLSDLGLDSLDVAQVLFTIENEMNISIESEDFENILTVGDALKIINKSKKS